MQLARDRLAEDHVIQLGPERTQNIVPGQFRAHYLDRPYRPCLSLR